MTSLPIIDPSLHRGGSGTGISYYMSAARCPRKARLDKSLGPDGESSKSSKTGTMFHSLMELFYSGQVGTECAAIQVADINYAEELQEAQRLAAAYFAKFPERDFWGDVVAVEKQLPAQEDQKQLVLDYFGVDLTARLDMVTEVSLHNRQRILERTGLDLEPGVYIIDHKTRSRRDNSITQTYSLSAQFKAYQLLWTKLHPETPCVGMIANVVIGTKEVQFQQAVITPPTDVELEGLRNWLKGAHALAETDFPNWAACHEAYGVCQYYTRGLCNRA